MNIQKIVLNISFLCLFAGFLYSAEAKNDLLILENNNSAYSIIISKNQPGSVAEGAKELQRLILKATGVKLPISYTADKNKKNIVVGPHPLAKAVGITNKGLAHDSFKIKELSGNLYLIGNDSNGSFYKVHYSGSPSAGTYYAVVEFARRFMGVRWYMPTLMGEEVPKKKRIAVPHGLDIELSPRFAVRYIRSMFYRDGNTEDSWRKKGMISGTYYDKDANKMSVKWGRHLRLGVALKRKFAHAWWKWVPAIKPNIRSKKAYGKEHPEYYALRGSKRQNYYRGSSMSGQLCVSNPDVAHVYAENVISYIKRTGNKNISLSCNDGGEHCQCKNCQAWNNKPLSAEKLYYTNREIRFSNRVAEKVVRVYPDVKFGQMAYHESRRPPLKLKIHPSITISDVYNYIPYKFYSSKEKKSMVDDIVGWRKMASSIVLTTYYLRIGHWSLPWSTDVSSSLVKILAQYKSSAGIYMNYGMDSVVPVGTLGADPWVFSNLLWNPDQSVKKLTQEYYLGAFGSKAGPLIQEYFDLINQSMIAQIKQKGYSGASSIQSYILPAYSNIRKACSERIEKAVKAVVNGPERYKWRVDRIARGWCFTELTLDAVQKAQKAALSTGKEAERLWRQAVELGKKRKALAVARDSVFALAPVIVDYADKEVPLGAITELPKNLDLTFRIPYSKEVFTIDGSLDEINWEKAAVLKPFKNNNNGKPPIVNTSVKAIYSEKGISIGIKCMEPYMSVLNINNKAGKIWNGDVMEISFSPSALDEYVWFIINPDNHAMSVIMRGDRGMDKKWKPDWQHAVMKGKDYWSVEIFIPWESITGGEKPVPGSLWRGNFLRKRFTKKMEFSAWAPTGSASPVPIKSGKLLFK